MTDTNAASPLTHTDRHFRQFIENLPIAVYATDQMGTITFYNDAVANLWGWRPALGDKNWHSTWRLYWADGTPLGYDECPMAIMLSTGQPIHGIEVHGERPDGTRYPFIPYSTPLLDDGGKLIGIINMLVDISDQKKGEYALQRLAAIVESSADAIISKDLNGIITSWNRGAENLFGYSAAEVVGKPVMMLIPQERHDEEPHILERIRKGEAIDHYETIRQRKDGSLIDISLTVSPMRSREGKIVGASKIARDITDRKRAEETKELLLHEIQHRVRNTLGIVHALAAQTFRGITTGERQAFTARLQALAGAHELLTRQSLNHAPIGQIVDQALAPFREGRKARFQVGGPDAVLNWTKATQLSMVIHELATNAVKYGALSNDKGEITAKWDWQEVDPPKKRIRFLWQETGGPAPPTPQRKGFGTTLVERALDGAHETRRLEFTPEGVKCVLEIDV